MCELEAVVTICLYKNIFSMPGMHVTTYFCVFMCFNINIVVFNTHFFISEVYSVVVFFSFSLLNGRALLMCELKLL